MTRITTLGVILAVLGVVALLVDCPYGVHIIIAGAILAVVGFFVRTTHRTTTSV